METDVISRSQGTKLLHGQQITLVKRISENNWGSRASAIVNNANARSEGTHLNGINNSVRKTRCRPNNLKREEYMSVRKKAHLM